MRPRTVQIILDIAHNVFYSGDLSVARPCSLSLNLDLYQNCMLTGDLKALLRALSSFSPTPVGQEIRVPACLQLLK